MRPARPHRKLGRFAAVLGITALVVTTAAAKGGSPRPGTPQCGVSPNPVTIGYGYTLLGANFAAGMGVTVYVADSATTSTYKGVVASNGTFAIPATADFGFSGTKNMYVNKTGDRKMVTYCQAAFIAQ